MTKFSDDSLNLINKAPFLSNYKGYLDKKKKQTLFQSIMPRGILDTIIIKKLHEPTLGMHLAQHPCLPEHHHSSHAKPMPDAMCRCCFIETTGLS